MAKICYKHKMWGTGGNPCVHIKANDDASATFPINPESVGIMSITLIEPICLFLTFMA